MLPNPVGQASYMELLTCSTAPRSREHQKQAKSSKANQTFFSGRIHPISDKTLDDDTLGGRARGLQFVAKSRDAYQHTQTQTTHTEPQKHTGTQ